MYKRWFTIVAVILVLFGVAYSTVGLKILPIVNPKVLLQWESYLYGAIMVGWGVTLLLVGRIAFENRDNNLKQALLIGLFCWLLVEAVASAALGVWPNVGVDVGVFALFAFPLLKSRR